MNHLDNRVCSNHTFFMIQTVNRQGQGVTGVGKAEANEQHKSINSAIIQILRFHQLTDRDDSVGVWAPRA